jgi:hypothetical protein
MLVGPIYFFSDIGGFIQINPVESASLGLSFIITKNITQKEFERSSIKFNSMDIGSESNEDSLNLDSMMTPTLLKEKEASEHDMNDERVYSKTPYKFFENANPYFRNYTKETYMHSHFSNWTETRFFKFN